MILYSMGSRTCYWAVSRMLISSSEPIAFQLANQAQFYSNLPSLQGQQTSDGLLNVDVLTWSMYRYLTTNSDLYLKEASTAAL